MNIDNRVLLLLKEAVNQGGGFQFRTGEPSLEFRAILSEYGTFIGEPPLFVINENGRRYASNDGLRGNMSHKRLDLIGLWSGIIATALGAIAAILGIIIHFLDKAK